LPHSEDRVAATGEKANEHELASHLHDPVQIMWKPVSVFSLVTMGLVGCTSADDATSGASSDLSSGPSATTAPAKGCIAAEGQICGTPADIACASGLRCVTFHGDLLQHPDGVCVGSGRALAPNPTPPQCAPVGAQEICGTAAHIACGPGLKCQFPAEAGLQEPDGLCRIEAGNPCSFVSLGGSFCDDFLVCDFDRATDPQGQHGTCRSSTRKCGDASTSSNGCPSGSMCVLQAAEVNNGGKVTGLCQMVPDRGEGEACAGLGGAACKAGLTCFVKPFTLPAQGGICMKPSNVPKCPFANPACCTGQLASFDTQCGGKAPQDS
jgi:hypothetical protein